MAERNVGNMVNDMCSGISFQAFLEKYEFPESKITSVLTYLVKNGGLTEREAKIWFNTARKNQSQPPIQQSPQEPVEELPPAIVKEPMILCPFCGEEIKKIAQKCKHCGEFLQKVPVYIEEEPKTEPKKLQKAQKAQKVQTIEKTSKRFKWQMAVSVFLMCASVFIFIVDVAVATDNGGDPNPIWPLIFVASLVWLIVVKALIWWNHE